MKKLTRSSINAHKLENKNGLKPEKFEGRKRWLPDMDSNHDKQIQRLLCYRYTIRQINWTREHSKTIFGVK
jgi:hypothetical protein